MYGTSRGKESYLRIHNFISLLYLSSQGFPDPLGGGGESDYPDL